MAYVSLKQSSLILVDAWYNPASAGYMKKLVEQKFEGDAIVRSVKLRQTGIISRAEIHLDMDGDKSLNDVEIMLLNTEKLIKSKMPSMDVVLVIPMRNEELQKIKINIHSTRVQFSMTV